MFSQLKQKIKNHRFFIGEQAGLAPVRLTHQRIYILPTTRGLGFVIILVVQLLIAFVYNNNLAYFLAFLLASVFFITILHSFKTLAGIIVKPGSVVPVFAGETASFVLVLQNPTPTPRFFQVSMADQQSVELAPFSNGSVALAVKTTRRGWCYANKITVATTYPLGLFRAWSPLRFELKVLVYPKPASQSTPFPESAGLTAEQGYSQLGADDFYGLASYQPGDSVKHIHWQSYAKGLGVFSKQYAGGNARELWLSYQATTGGDVEQRLSQLCRWLIDAEQAGLSYGLILPNLRITVSSGHSHTEQCLEALALF
ncbi:hypothetical protein VZ94_20645 [Methylocucumis oryzae]|uniref:Uncharacterized protein n=2 Tax=Methylocucumis oryzae TaxID=1632867 RepID=A0A0F3IEC9_9GAMM|nr:hypothetical protein VZ94_20645 [Methylocucumis oryzae]